MKMGTTRKTRGLITIFLLMMAMLLLPQTVSAVEYDDDYDYEDEVVMYDATTITLFTAPRVGFLTVKWDERDDAEDYELSYATSSDFSNERTETVYDNEAELKPLRSGATHYARVRCRYYVSRNHYEYSDWSEVKEVKAASPVKVSGITVKKPDPTYLKVSFKKANGAEGYTVQYAKKKSFGGKRTVTLSGAKSVKLSIPVLSPGKKQYIRVRAFYTAADGSTINGAWSKVKAVKTANKKTVAANVGQFAIEADVTLSGSGSGYHAKLVMGTPTSAVSFGIQYDAHAVAPYTGRAMLMVENVESNNVGGQTYDRPGNIELQVGKTYHLMMATNGKGKVTVYLNYKAIATYYNAGMNGSAPYLRVEGAARLNGDKVNAKFSNIRLRIYGKYDPSEALRDSNFDTNQTVHSVFKSPSTVTIKGTISGLAAGADWDSAYDKVSGIMQFNYTLK